MVYQLYIVLTKMSFTQPPMLLTSSSFLYCGTVYFSQPGDQPNVVNFLGYLGGKQTFVSKLLVDSRVFQRGLTINNLLGKVCRTS